MSLYLKTVKTVLTLTLVVYVSFSIAPYAYAAQQQKDPSQVFTQCMERGELVALAKSGVQAGIEAVVAAAAASTATAAAGVASAVNVPTTNPSAAPTAGITAGTEVSNSVWKDDVKPYFDELAYILGQCTLEQVTANTVSWIKGGFHGSPSFAINPNKIFLDLQDSVANQLAKQVVDVRLNDFIPGFSNNLTKSIELSTRVDARGKFASKLKTTFPVDVQPQAFYQDFSQGGWGAFGASLAPNNNPFGVMMIVGDELAARQIEAGTTQQQKLDWSKGYIDIVDTDACDYPQGGDFRISSDDGGVVLANGQPDPSIYTPAEITSLQKQYCDTTTPGGVISDQLQKTLGTDVDRLGLADDVDKIITTLITTLVQDTARHVF